MSKVIVYLVDLACYFGIWMLIRNHPNAGWVITLVLVYGLVNWIEGRIKGDCDE